MQYFVHETAFVEEEVNIGEDTKIWHHCHIRKGAKIGKNCILGKGVFIDTDVEIGDGVKVQNRVSVYRGVTIENEVFVGPHVAFTNDMYPRAFNTSWKCIPTLVKSGASISAGSVILCGITLGNYCMVGAGSVVTHDVPDHVLVFGNPARTRKIVCKCGIPLNKKEGRVDNMKKRVIFNCNDCGSTVAVSREIFDHLPD